MVCFLLCMLLSAGAADLEFDFDVDDMDGLPAALSKAVGEAYDLNKRGLEALESKHYDAALDLFNQALKVLPDYSDAENNRGVVYYRMGQIGRAGERWEAVASKARGYAPGRYNLGLIQLHERQHEAALRLFERALKADGRFVEALVRSGTTQIELGRQSKGLDYLKKAYRIAPAHPDAWSFLAFGLIASGDTAEALRILKKNETDPRALRLLGSIENSRHNSKRAAGYFSAAVNRGADPSLLVELASSQMESGDCKEALSTINRYFAMKTARVADAYLTAGIAAKECGSIADAEKYFEEGVAAYPKDPILSYNLGQVYFHRKKYDLAEQTWVGLSDSLQDPSLLYMRALNARRRGDFTTAKKSIERALAMDNRAEFHDLLGVIFHKQGDDKRAEEEFRKAISINPGLRSAQLNLALLSRKGEDLGAATASLERQLASCGSDECATMAFQLAILYYHRKMADKAAATLAAVKEQDRDERIYRHLALFYRELQDWNSAIATLESAAKNLVLEPQTE